MGPHTTADDPTRYRDANELDLWAAKDPIDSGSVLLVWWASQRVAFKELHACRSCVVKPGGDIRINRTGELILCRCPTRPSPPSIPDSRRPRARG